MKICVLLVMLYLYGNRYWDHGDFGKLKFPQKSVLSCELCLRVLLLEMRMFYIALVSSTRRKRNTFFIS